MWETDPVVIPKEKYATLIGMHLLIACLPKSC